MGDRRKLGREAVAARARVGAFTVVDGRIVEIDLIADPDKLRRLGLA
jgi:hypothetical protein